MCDLIVTGIFLVQKELKVPETRPIKNVQDHFAWLFSLHFRGDSHYLKLYLDLLLRVVLWLNQISMTYQDNANAYLH